VKNSNLTSLIVTAVKTPQKTVLITSHETTRRHIPEAFIMKLYRHYKRPGFRRFQYSKGNSSTGGNTALSALVIRVAVLRKFWRTESNTFFIEGPITGLIII
jgi:hypothetical protein